MTKRLLLLLLAACTLSLAGQLLLYPHLPSLVPTHWGINGQVDVWGPKYINLLLDFLPLVFTLVFYYLPRLDPRRANYKKHSRAYSAFVIALAAFLICLTWAVTLSALGLRLPVSSIIIILVGILFLIMGNFMPQVRSTFFFGFRTPWTLDNETVWRKTNRLGGVLLFISGILIIVSAFWHGWPSFILILVCAALCGLIPVIYSFIVFKRIQKEEKNEHAEN